MEKWQSRNTVLQKCFTFIWIDICLLSFFLMNLPILLILLYLRETKYLKWNDFMIPWNKQLYQNVYIWQECAHNYPKNLLIITNTEWLCLSAHCSDSDRAWRHLHVGHQSPANQSSACHCKSPQIVHLLLCATDVAFVFELFSFCIKKINKSHNKPKLKSCLCRQEWYCQAYACLPKSSIFIQAYLHTINNVILRSTDSESTTLAIFLIKEIYVTLSNGMAFKILYL